MSTATAIPFDTLAFVRELETAGVPPAQAEAQAKALSGILQKLEESRLQELATKGDILRLEKEIEIAKVETIKWVVATGIVILGGVAAINRPLPTITSHITPAQEMRLPVPQTPTR
ncbi:MAG: CCDC90 family protein [Magnetococcus sp. YQC-5]